MGLFKQNIYLKIDDENNIVEKKDLVIKKRKVDIKVESGVQAKIGAENLIGGETYPYSKKVFGKTAVAFVFRKDKNYDSISFNFSTGEYTLTLDELEGAKAKYCINGTATCELFSIERLAKYFNSNVSMNDVLKEIQETVRDSFVADAKMSIGKFINSDTKSSDAYNEFVKIRKDIVTSNTSSIQKINQMGLDISESGIVFKLTPVTDTEELVDKVNTKLQQNAIERLDEVKSDKQRNQRLEEKEMDQVHEVNVIRAQNTSITETKIEGNNPKDEEKEEKDTKFCKFCGVEVPVKAKFCPKCGRNIEEV
ncbi:MAG: zinc ribbon domain-containing protein [Acholeplasmatales bacterium]|nr:zinc ribbon domain-containing protein [Acholeplasmatales bacterium]